MPTQELRLRCITEGDPSGAKLVVEAVEQLEDAATSSSAAVSKMGEAMAKGFERPRDEMGRFTSQAQGLGASIAQGFDQATATTNKFQVALSDLPPHLQDAINGAQKAGDTVDAATKKMLEGWTAQIRPLDQLEKEFSQLVAAGANVDAFAKRFSKEIITGAAAQQKFGQELTSVQKSLLAEANAFQEVEKAGKSMAAASKSAATEMKEVGTAAKDSGMSFGKLVGSFITAQAVIGALKTGFNLFVGTLKEGIQAVFENDAAMSRASETAKRWGLSMADITTAAEKIQNPLLEATNKLSMMSDLLNKGFSIDQASKMVDAFGDLAAAGKDAGQTVQDAMGMITKAITTGRVSGEELIRMVPSLKGLSKELTGMATGQASASDIAKVFNAVMKDQQAVMGSLAEYIKKPQGQLELLKVQLNETKEALGTGFLNGIKPLATMFTELSGKATGLQDVVQKLGFFLGTAITKGVQLAIESFLVMKATIIALEIVWNQIKFTVAQVVLSIVNSIKALADAMAKIPLAPPQWKQASKELAVIGGQMAIAMGQSSVAISKLNPEFEKAAKEAGEMHLQLIKAPPTLKEFTAAAGSAGPPLAKLGEGVEGAGKKVSEALPKFKDFIQNLEDLRPALGILDTSTFENWSAAANLLGVWEQATAELDDELGGLQLNLGSVLDASNQANAGILGSVDAFQKADTSIEKVSNSLDKLITKTAQWGQVLGQIGANIGGTFGGIISSVGAGFDSFSKMMEQMGDKAGAMAVSIVSGISTALQGIGQAIGGKGGAILGAIGNIGSAFASGFAVGGPIGGAIAGGLAAIGELFKAFGKDWVGDIKKTTAAMGLALSEGLTNSIAELAEKIGDEVTAINLSLGSIVDEMGTEGGNLEKFTGMLADTFRLWKEGFLDAAQAAEVFGNVWPKLAQASLDATGIISSGLQDIARMAAESGLNVSEIEGFLRDQISRVQGLIAEQVDKLKGALSVLTTSFASDLEAMMKKLEDGMLSLDKVKPPEGDIRIRPINEDGTEPPTPFADVDLQKLQEDFNTLSDIVVATAASILAAGGDMSDVLAAVGGSVDQLKKAMKEFGLEGDQALKSVISQLNFAKKFEEPLSKLKALSDGMSALNQLGLLNQKTFSDMQKSMSSQFDIIIGKGGASRKELAAMKPELLQLAMLSEKYGLTLDPNIQRLIDLAKKQGIITENDFAPTLEESMVDLNATLKSLQETLALFLGTMQAIPSQINTTVTTNYETTGEPPPLGDDIRFRAIPPSFAGLQDPIMFIRPTVIKAHSGETLFPSAQNARQSSFGDPVRNPGMDTRQTTNYITLNVHHPSQSEMVQMLQRIFDQGLVSLDRS